MLVTEFINGWQKYITVGDERFQFFEDVNQANVDDDLGSVLNDAETHYGTWEVSYDEHGNAAVYVPCG